MQFYEWTTTTQHYIESVIDTIIDSILYQLEEEDMILQMQSGYITLIALN